MCAAMCVVVSVPDALLGSCAALRDARDADETRERGGGDGPRLKLPFYASCERERVCAGRT